jgi:ATP-dependent exoDNAse (exonuclease V) beta subunit
MKRAKPISANQLSLFDAPPPAPPKASPPRDPAPRDPFTLSLLKGAVATEAPAAGVSSVLASVPAPDPSTAEPLRVSSAQGERSLNESLRLDANLALMAGAGTGKTHNLITLCLHLLGGARAGERIEPQSLGLLTFTDKAAAEMRQRLYKRVDALARGGTGEPELFDSYDKLGLTPPKPAFWRGVRDSLGGAPIGTFHSLCVQLLREAPAGRAFTPAFELLDDQQAIELLFDLAERVVIAAVERGDPHISELVREWTLASPMGAATTLAMVYARVREEGEAPATLTLSDPTVAMAEFNAQRERTRSALTSSYADIQRTPRRDWQEKLDTVQRALDGLTFDNAAERLPVASEAAKGGKFPRVRDALALLRQCAAGVRVVPYERAFRTLLVELAAEHHAALRKRNALDFAALLVESRDLLRDDLDFRSRAQGRFKALLVDELQDTNRVQLELLHLLGEQREGAPRPTNPPLIGSAYSVTQLPLEPAYLCVVGDRKQSIYEFRGADVAVVEQAARAIEASGGGRAFLTVSRRASPKLVGFFNAVMPKLMADIRTQPLVTMKPEDGQVIHGITPSRSFEVSYVPAHDDLSAHRAQEGDAAAVERFVKADPEATADELRALDSRVLARRIRELLESGRFQGRDIVMLFRRFTFVEDYRQALIAEGVPHRLVRGRGFYGAQEVMDLAALLRLVTDPSDAMALAVVLRSPLVGLTDASLLRISKASGERLDARIALALVDLPALSDFEGQRFRQLQVLVKRLRAEQHKAPVRALLKTALETTGYLEAMAATPFGAQVLANVEKLLELSAKADDCAAFARTLTSLSDADPLEAQADVIDEDDPHAVTLCTIHQSKGLEWPVVVLPELFSPTAPRGARVRFERDQGLSLKPPDLIGDDTGSPRFERAKDERSAREAADFKRLRYVALTRAKDLVVLGAVGAPKKRGAWLDLEDAVIGFPGIVEHPFVEPPPKPPMKRVTEESSEALQAAAQRLATRPAPVSRAAMLPVTQLQDFALCPRRYRFAYLLGIPEPRSGPPRAVLETGSDDEPLIDIRERGTAAHKLLEKVVLGAPIEAQLVDIERSEGLADDPEVRGWVRRFLETPFARAMTDVRRELPFVLRLTDAQGFTLHLRGQIDLLVINGDGSATVVDYKTSVRPEDGLDAYRFQLGCYVLAAKALLGDVPIRAGIAFLREADASPQLLPPGVPIDEGSLATQARALVSAQISGDWQGLPEARCRSLGCGYVSRCHPHSTPL